MVRRQIPSSHRRELGIRLSWRDCLKHFSWYQRSHLSQPIISASSDVKQLHALSSSLISSRSCARSSSTLVPLLAAAYNSVMVELSHRCWRQALTSLGGERGLRTHIHAAHRSRRFHGHGKRERYVYISKKRRGLPETRLVNLEALSAPNLFRTRTGIIKLKCPRKYVCVCVFRYR
jgi:hypothetical protein